jgi:hypothetical protein
VAREWDLFRERPYGQKVVKLDAVVTTAAAGGSALGATRLPV